jgi:glycolate oxidase iron-sulfur subunit
MKDYGHWLADDPEWSPRAAGFSRRVVDICELLHRSGLKPPQRTVPLRVAYDDPCHLVHAQRIRDQPRALLKQIPGMELAELPEADWCCGSAGSYTVTQPEMSARVLERKVGHIAALGVEAIATGNPGCMMQIATGARQRGLPLRVVHPVELIAMAYADSPEEPAD